MKTFFKFPVLIIIIISVITILFVIPIPTLQIDNDTTRFLPESNPDRQEYLKIENQYGGNMMMAVSIKFKDGYVYSNENLLFIQKLTEEFESMSTLDKVTSIINVDYIIGTESGIETTKLIEKIPENEYEENSIKERLLSWDLYKGNLFSEDFKSTLIALKLKLGVKNKNAEESYKKVKSILEKYKSDKYELYIAGLPAVLVIIADSMRKDLVKLIPFVVIILILTLFLSFRRLGGIVLPTITVLITTVWTLGIMAIFKINLTMIASAIPVLMIAVGSAYGIHIISHYFDEIDKEILLNKDISEIRNREIIFDTIKRIGGAVFLAAITTMAGFGSLATGKIVPIKEFGIFTSIGVLIAFIISLTLIPSILLVRHKALKAKIKKEENNNKKMDILTKGLFLMYQFLSKGKIRVIIIFVIILFIAIFGTTRIIIGNPMVNYFKKDTEIKKADTFANKNFNGTTMLTMVIRGKNSGDLTEPDILKKLDDLQKYLKTKYKDIGNIMSFTELIKKMNQVMNADEKGDYYEIPYDPEKYRCKDRQELKQLIAQYLLLFSGNLEEYVDDSIEPSQTKVEIILKNPDFDLIRKIEKDIYDYTKKNFPENYKVIISGNAKLQVVVSNLIVSSQITNIIFSLIAVFLILTIYYKSGIAGIFGVITLSIPIFLNFGVMGFLKIRLDAGTAMVASVAIGIGIDYTIHFMNAYHHERKKSSNLDVVTTNSLLTCGKAIIFNALSVGLGFLVLVFSSFMPLIYFGALLAFTMVTSSVSSMTLLPVMLNIFKPKFISKN